MQRWREERILLQSEMDWTARSFASRAEEWSTRAELASTQGGKEYALRQQHQWQEMLEYAQFGIRAMEKMSSTES